jgi:hypothetical protein
MTGERECPEGCTAVREYHHFAYGLSDGNFPSLSAYRKEKTVFVVA